MYVDDNRGRGRPKKRVGCDGESVSDMSKAGVSEEDVRNRVK